MAFPLNPTAYWKLENTNDSITRGYNLTNNGTVTFSAAKIDNGAVFNGSSQSLNNNSIWGATSYPRSYGGWVKFDTVASGDNQVIFAIGDGSIHYYTLRLRDSDNKIVFRSNNNTEAADVDTGIVASAGVWYHVVVVQHSATSVSLYVDGVKTNTTATTFSATVSQFYLGYLGRSSVWWLDGIIDEVGFWSKALSDAEVTSLYNGGAGLQPDLLTSLEHYYEFDEASGNAADEVGSATLTNSSVTYAAGKINNASVYNGSAHFTNASSIVNLDSNRAFSFSYWIKTSTTGAMYVATRQNNSNFHAQWNLFVNGESVNGSVLFQIHPANSNSNSLYVRTGNVSINNGSWHHVAVTYDGSRTPGGVKIYVDGASQSLTTVLNNLTTNAPTGTPVYIGNRGAAGTPFTGDLDEFAIWKRELTAADVTSLYNGGNGFQYPFPSAVDVNDFREAEVTGAITLADNRDAEIHGKATTNDFKEAEVHGQASVNNAREAEVHGVATTNDARESEITGAVFQDSNRDSEIHGVAVINDIRDAEIRGSLDSDDTRESEIYGAITPTDIRESEIHGTASDNDARDAEVFGAITVDDNRDVEITGTIADDDVRDSEIHGANLDDDERASQIHGQDTANDVRDSEVHGFDTDDSARDAEVRGMVVISDYRSAQISGYLIPGGFIRGLNKDTNTKVGTRKRPVVGRNNNTNTGIGRRLH